MPRLLLVIFVSLLSLVGCTQFTTTVDGFGFSEDVEAYNESVFEALNSGSSNDLLEMLSDDLQATEDIATIIETLQAQFRAHPTDFKRIATQTRRVTQNGETSATHQSYWETAYGDGYLTIDLVVSSELECCEIINLRTYEDEVSPSARNNFGEASLSFGRIIFLILLVLNILFIIASLIACIRDKGLVKRKWLWILFILFGMWGVSLNWTTGQLSPNFISANPETGSFKFLIVTFQILGASVTKAGIYAPWLMEIGLPLGAILYWIKRRKRTSTQEVL